MIIYCCACVKEVNARLTDGQEIYPHRKDLYHLPFYKCDSCNNYVGTHHKTKDKFKPLGCIPSTAIMNARKHIHIILDPLWKNKIISRSEIYDYLSNKIGWDYHTAKIRTIEEARIIYRYILQLRRTLICK